LHLKQSLGFDAGDPVLLVMARLEPQKGHSVLLKALPAIRAEFPRVRLVCAGEGSLRAGLEAEARDLGLEASARFVGHQANVMDWLALADATVLPSHFEGLPLAAIESLAAAKPMIATAVDGTPEVVVNGKTGLTVPPGDVSALAAAICTLLRDPALRRSLGQAGRQWVLDRFSREGQIRRTEELYLRVWSEKQARSKALGRRNPALQERTKGLEARLTSETRG
jgi:glycosyltransferase involved in cell wall biosynthesis